MGKLTFGGKTYRISDKMAWPVLVIMTVFLFVYFFGFLIYGSAALSFFLEIPRWGALLGIIFLTFSIKIGDTETAIFPESVRSAINFMIVWSTVYFLYTYQQWAIWELLLLCVYPIGSLIGHIRQLMDFIKKDEEKTRH